MGEDSGEKTEEPTPHKLREARKKGQVAKSKDLTTAILMLVSFNVMKGTAQQVWNYLVEISYFTFSLIPEDFSPTVAGNLLDQAMHIFLLAMMPLFMANLMVAIIVEALQTGFLVAFDSISPKFEKLNPIEGAKKFFSLKQYVELLKSVLKMAVVIYIIWQALVEEFYMVILSQQLTLWQVMAFTGHLVMKTVTRVAMFYFVIAIFDYMYQRYEHIKGLKMSKKEIKDEYKRLEGDPTIKQRQRDAQRQMSQGRQMGAVPDADVVVTNPVHIAIAIQYTPNRMKAPKVLAKGKRLVAQQIKQIAEERYIPIVENPPLAQSMYDLVEAGSLVPPLFYKAVADILAFVYNLKKKRKHRY